MKYLHREESHVSFEDRCEKYRQKPGIFWFTGFSGAGKSTIADAFEKKLFDRGYFAFTMDADDLRKRLNADLGFSMEDRAENIRRASEAARLLQDAGLIVLASFISPTHEIRRKAREVAREGLFFEILVKAELDTCIQRDPKGFYAKALKGEIKNYTGIASGYEEPLNPELVLDTDKDDVETCVGKLMRLAEDAGLLEKEK